MKTIVIILASALALLAQPEGQDAVHVDRVAEDGRPLGGETFYVKAPALKSQHRSAVIGRPNDQINNFGVNRVLVILANFSDRKNTTITRDQAQTWFNGYANNWFIETSYGKTSLQTDVVGWFDLPLSASASTFGTGDALFAAAVQAADPSVDFRLYRHVVVFAPWFYNGYGGIAQSNHQFTTGEGTLLAQRAIVWDRNTTGSIPAHSLRFSEMTHEISHGYNAGHDNALSRPVGGPAYTLGSGYGCAFSIYGNFYSAMGGDASFSGHHTAGVKADQIGWLSGSNLLDLSSATGPTTVTIEPYETNTGGVKAVRWLRAVIVPGVLPNYFYMEFRQPIGDDAFISGPGVFQGISITSRTAIIDTSPSYIPGTTSDLSTGVNDHNLKPGQTFTDPATGFRVTTNSVSAAGANVTITPGIPDTQKPAVRLTSPMPSILSPCPNPIPYPTISVSGVVPLAVDVSDDRGIHRVDYFFNHFTVPSSSGYSLAWDSRRSRNGIMDVRAQAYDLVGNRTDSCWISLDINNPPDTVPPAVTLVGPADGSTVIGNHLWINVAATDNTGLERFDVFLDGNPLLSWSIVGPFGKVFPAAYSINMLTASPASGTHTIRVRAYDFWGNYADSAVHTVHVNPPIAIDVVAPTVPQSLSASPASSSQIRLSWAASIDNLAVAGYRIYRNGAQVATTTGTSYQDTGLAPSTRYTYAVAAYDAAGNLSGQSAPASAATSACIPIGKSGKCR